MKIKHLDHINLSVTDFDKTVAWYGRLFDFKLVEEALQDGVRWGVIRSGEALLCIYEHPERKFLDRFELGDHKLHGMAHFGLRILSKSEWLEIVEREQVPVLYDGVISWPHSQAWYVNDPTGYEIEVALWNDDQIQFTESTATPTDKYT